MRDFPAAMQLLTGSIVGSLVYGAQSHMRLIGDPDRERKLAQRLEFGSLALAGFTRSSLGRSSWAYIHSIISLLFCNQYLVGQQ